MLRCNTPQKILDSWKRIAAFLERSERTVRRWEATECFPIHRRGDKRQDTFYAYPQEVDDWSWKRRQFTGASGPEEAEPMPLAKGYLRR